MGFYSFNLCFWSDKNYEPHDELATFMDKPMIKRDNPFSQWNQIVRY